MKKIILALLAAAAISQTAWATEVTVGTDIYSAYVSRGSVLNDEPVLQPDIYFDAPYGFSFELWGTMDMTDNDKSCAPDTAWRFSEFDFILGWSAPLPEDSPISLGVASTLYTYPQFDDDDDYDVSVSVGGNCILKPTLVFVHECDRDDDYRLDLKLSHDIVLQDALSLTLKGQCTYGFDGWMEKWNRGTEEGTVVKGGDAGLVDVMVSATLKYQITDSWSVGVIGAFSALVDGDARDAADFDDVDTDIFYGGLTTSWTF